MTDEEKEAKEYSQGNFYSEQGFLYGYERGFAEGRKKCLEQNKDGTIRPCKVMKDNEELKAQIEQLQQAYTITVDKSVIREQELEAQIERISVTNFSVIEKLKAEKYFYKKDTQELEKENAELKAKLNGALDICNIPEFRINDLEKENVEVKKENKELKNAIEKAKKDHVIFTKSEVINFTSKCVWEALNPETKMCIPNAMYIKIEELLKDFIENGVTE